MCTIQTFIFYNGINCLKKKSLSELPIQERHYLHTRFCSLKPIQSSTEMMLNISEYSHRLRLLPNHSSGSSRYRHGLWSALEGTWVQPFWHIYFKLSSKFHQVNAGMVQTKISRYTPISSAEKYWIPRQADKLLRTGHTDFGKLGSEPLSSRELDRNCCKRPEIQFHYFLIDWSPFLCITWCPW